MARWEPDSRERLLQAALELYAERGFESTTVAEIAGRAGLTERTFFRHFADKREVLFGGESVLQGEVLRAAGEAPPSASPLEAAAAGIAAAGVVLPEDAGTARRRQGIINANDELRERELIKLASLSTALRDTLRARGVTDAEAGLTAEIAVAVFKVAFERWIDEDNEREFGALVRESVEQLAAVTRPTA